MSEREFAASQRVLVAICVVPTVLLSRGLDALKVSELAPQLGVVRVGVQWGVPNANTL